MFKLDQGLTFFPVAVVTIMLAGTIGFSWLEHLPFLHSFYFTFITAATVGYGDISPHTHAGKVRAMAVNHFRRRLLLGG